MSTSKKPETSITYPHHAQSVGATTSAGASPHPSIQAPGGSVDAVVSGLIALVTQQDADTMDTVTEYLQTVWHGDLRAAAAGYRKDPTWLAHEAFAEEHALDPARFKAAMPCLLLDGRLPIELRGRLTFLHRFALLAVNDDALLARLAAEAISGHLDYLELQTRAAVLWHQSTNRGMEKLDEWLGSAQEMGGLLEEAGLGEDQLNGAVFGVAGVQAARFEDLPPAIQRSVFAKRDLLSMLTNVVRLLVDAAAPGGDLEAYDLVESIQDEIEFFAAARDAA